MDETTPCPLGYCDQNDKALLIAAAEIPLDLMAASNEGPADNDFFERLNRPVPANTPTYMANSALPLFQYFKLTNIGPFTTTVGPTARVQCKINEETEIFFFLNRIDFSNMTLEDINTLQAMVTESTAPFVFIAKTTRALKTVFLPYSNDTNADYEANIKVKISKIPHSVRTQINFVELARSGIVLQQ
ncbi:Tripeptidyl-peptidase SED4 [Frankliniella fusca]|uniref:Tripeptidyl-peptidase SED4 n=1 Tax=Frankliniella fusca TaxID=407009 RepID=A0AAE1HZR5_9NEOP|nr:Tripeptidyl-peptidase SED4 [Frankliniella fusca]